MRDIDCVDDCVRVDDCVGLRVCVSEELCVLLRDCVTLAETDCVPVGLHADFAARSSMAPYPVSGAQLDPSGPTNVPLATPKPASGT